MGANYSFEVKNIEIWAPAFFKHNDLFIATVLYKGVKASSYSISAEVLKYGFS